MDLSKKLFVLLFTGLLLSFSITVYAVVAHAEPGDMTQAELDAYDRQCPYGDAVMVPKMAKEPTVNTVSVDCINYDAKGKVWTTWIWTEKGKKGNWVKSEQEFPISAWEAYTMDGQLYVAVSGLVKIMPYSHDSPFMNVPQNLSDMEAEAKVKAPLQSTIIKRGK